MIELCIGPKAVKPVNAAKAWSTTELNILARMILENDSYSKISTILGRSVSAIKSMIDGRSGKKSYAYLQQVTEKLIEANKKLAGAKKVPLSLADDFKEEEPLRAWPFPTSKAVKSDAASWATKNPSTPAAPKPHNYRSRWTKTDDEKLISHFEKNYSVNYMAASLGRSPYGVLSRLSTLGRLSYNKDENAYYKKTLYAKLPL